MVKIGGVVRILNQVRGKLQTGLRPDEVDDFRNVVRNAVHDIERICAKARQTPRALPGPSRMAYDFLKSLDLANLPIKHSGFRIYKDCNSPSGSLQFIS